MKKLSWSLLKSAELKEARGVSFEEIIHAKLIAVLEHPQRKHQNIMLYEYKDYIWIVPYVDTKNEIFLKTLFPSRKYTKLWRQGKL